MIIPVDYYSYILIGLFNNKNNMSRFQQLIINFILYTAFSCLVIGSVDFFMDDIHITPANQVLFILLYYLFKSYSDIVFLTKK